MLKRYASSTALTLLAGLVLGAVPVVHSQVRRNIKVVVETRQSGVSSQESVRASGGIIIRRGTAQPSGRITANDRQTTVQRSSGVFTLVRDGGESTLLVATRVPEDERIFYHNYVTGAGYVERQIVATLAKCKDPTASAPRFACG